MGRMLRIGAGLAAVLAAVATPVMAEAGNALSSIRLSEPSDVALFAIGLIGLAIGRLSGRVTRRRER